MTAQLGRIYMASMANDPGGGRRILFFDASGRRRSLRLGKISKRQADTVRVHVEQVVNAQMTQTAPPLETTRWIAGLNDVMLAKLARVGLAEKRERSSLGDFLEAYVTSRP